MREVSIVGEEKVGDKVNIWRRRSHTKKLPVVPLSVRSVPVDPLPREVLIEPLIVNPEIVLSPVIEQLIDETLNGLEKGNQPIRSPEGTGGAYFMQDLSGQKYVSVFKPVDEELMAVNNPRGYTLSPNGESLKEGTRVGEGAIREVAAYILGHPRGGPRPTGSDKKGFAGVPPTVMVRCQHSAFHYSEGFDRASSKIGSLQMFMRNRGSSEDMGPGAFSVEEVHKICILDIRLANADKHAFSVFKPVDEELMAVNNPRGYILSPNGESLKEGTRVGEGAIKEVAAYILDHPRGGPRPTGSDKKGFAGVPPTVMVRCQHSAFHYSEGFDRASSKIGSLQMFMRNRGSSEDMGPSAFSVDEVHKICILDIRLANADKHAGNILIQTHSTSPTCSTSQNGRTMPYL